MKTITEIGFEDGREAVRQAGTSPVNADGELTLPTDPLPGDWDHLEEHVMAYPDERAKRMYADAWKAGARAEIYERASHGPYGPEVLEALEGSEWAGTLDELNAHKKGE